MAQHDQDELDQQMKAAQERWSTEDGEPRDSKAILADAVEVVRKAADAARSRYRAGNFGMASQEQAVKEQMEGIERLVVELEGLRDA